MEFYNFSIAFRFFLVGVLFFHTIGGMILEKVRERRMRRLMA